MLNILRKNQKIFIFIALFVLGLCIGLPLSINNISSDYFDFALLANKISYMHNNDYYSYFVNSTFSYENSILFSIILLGNKNNNIFYYHNISIIISIILYVLAFFEIYKISIKNKISTSLIFIPISVLLLINVCFQNINSSFIETKISLIGILLFLNIRNIKNEKIKLIFNLIVVLLFYNLVLLIMIVFDFILKCYKNKAFILNDFILFFEAIFLFFFLLDMNLGLNYNWIPNLFLYVIDYMPMDVYYPYSVLFSLVILLLFAFNIFVLLFEKHNRSEHIKYAIAVLLFTLFVSITNKESNILCSLRYYYSLFYLIVVYFDCKYVETKQIKMNIFTEGKFSFSLIKSMSLVMILLQVVGFSSIEYKSTNLDEINYRLKYDYDYNYVTGRFDENEGYKDLINALRDCGMVIDFNIPVNEDYTVFRNPDIFIYGYGEVEDGNGSRWMEKKAALNLYGRAGDQLLFTIYNPADKVGVEFELYVDNVLVYSGVTVEGEQTIYADCDFDTGNHIIKAVLTNFNADSRFGLYVTNVVLGRFS